MPGDSQETDLPEALSEEAVAEAVGHAMSALEAASSMDELKEANTAHMGGKSPLALANRLIGKLPPALKGVAGKRVGMARASIKKAYEPRVETLEKAESNLVLEQEKVDVTAVPHRRRRGARHPLSTLQESVADIFVAMGWDIVDGPEVESEWFCFDALNFGPDHPARQMQDTFYVDPAGSGLVMRTHTSPVQIRALLERGAPLYIACPGKVFRTDELDATHLPVFHQIEGLAIDKNLTMAHLRGTLDHLAKQMFGENVTTRLRPSFFPFTEPSAEVDIQCSTSPGAGGENAEALGNLNNTGWVEWGGCGMVNPNVLRACGLDPDVYQGYAFGMGIERALMFRRGVTDMREMIEGDVRFSNQFSVEI